ncbi:hypothetical protein CE91St31_07710 [Raoultibacter timonensis]|nr:hypothetical protein CE91St31_07710 [Raoultibacter timonensis]
MAAARQTRWGFRMLWPHRCPLTCLDPPQGPIRFALRRPGSIERISEIGNRKRIYEKADVRSLRGHDNLEISRWATQLTAFGHALPERRIVVLGMTDRATNAVPGLRFR